MRRRRKINIISYILTLVLTISLIGISLLGFGKYSMFSLRGVMHSCDKVSYSLGLCLEMHQEAYYLATPYGLDKKCLDGVFETNSVRKDIEKALESRIKGETYTADTENIRTKIQQNVEDNYGKLGDKEKESLQEYASQVESMYQKKIVIPGSDSIADMINAFSKITIIGIPLLVLIAIVCVLLLVSMRRLFYHGLRFVAYGTMGAGVTLLTVFAAYISDASMYKFNLSDVYFRAFLIYLIGHEMLMQAFVGIGLLLVGLVLIYIVFREKMLSEQ